jgi:HSP20 family molecular chaperone IbpA
MPSSIKPKFDTQLKRQISQANAEQKSKMNSNSLAELKNLGQAIKQSQAENRALNHTEHAINHIKSRSTENTSEEETTSNIDNTRLYTRQGKIENIEVSDDSVPSEVETVDARLARHKSEKIQTKQQHQTTPVDDEFYKVKDRGNTITEDMQGYYIEAYAPEHEKTGVRVSITHNKAVISGSRKAQNEEESERGKMMTNNFQTFREEFNLSTPVASEGITRERNGDYIRFFIPKLGSKVESES